MLRNLALVGVLARAGLRLSEALALNTDDVELRPRSGWALIRQGKGAKERQVPLNTELRWAVTEYLDARPEGMASELALFVTRSGKRLGPRAVQRMVAGAARRAGIERQVTPHMLRHTFATRFLQKGGDLATLRAILGHASIATTSRYLHPNAAQMQVMVEGV
jgi:site-specific recombinase XerD